MHTSQRMGDESEGVFKGSSLQSAFRSGAITLGHGRPEDLSPLRGATLAERVIRFLERYETPMYGLR